MQDIDFDELDRAVSSATADTAPAQPTPEPASSPAMRRSSGRFMDVVHPSSDMRPATTERSAPRAPEPPRSVAPIPTADTSEPSSHEWPDPIDFHESQTAPVTGPETAAPAEEVPTPLESPFLSDAKIEKRPLGAFSDAEPTPPPAPEAAPVAAEAEPEPELLLEAPDTELIEAHSEVAPAPEAPQPQDEPVGPTSITQQYKEQPSTTEQPSGAIFDTEAYHKPLTHAPKKSGALVIIWIIALLLVGAGAGAAVYFFVLPMF